MATAKLSPLEQQPADLAAERQRCSFPVEELTHLFHGGQQAWERKRWIMSLVENDPVFDRKDRHFLSRSQRFNQGLRRMHRMVVLRNKHSLSMEDTVVLRTACDEYVPTHLHTDMFIPMLQLQATDEQQAAWLPDAMQMRIIGCYAQTELGHGSNLSGLETTATLDRATDEWVIHTPHLSSAKFWIGGLGKASTHAIVVAKLIIDGKDCGPHPLFTPIRSRETHRVLDGITIYDIGPKVGGNTMDNGCMIFNHYRIPRTNMLMRYSQVSRDGVYSRPIHDKLAYGAMTGVRTFLVEASGHVLSRACIIAARYLAVRRQGQPEQPDQLEPQVLDHLMVQYRLLPRIAQSYALHLTSSWMSSMYTELIARLRKNDISMLADVHAYSSGLKSYATTIAVSGIEDLRKCLGGHGYSMSSGIPDFYSTALPMNTYEGENCLLTQQTARFLLKQVQLVRKGKQAALSSTVDYLGQLAKPELFARQRWHVQTAEDLHNPEVILAAFRHRAARVVHALATAAEAGTPWSELQVDCYAVSHAHCQQLVSLCVARYLTTPEAGRLAASTRRVFTQLMSLYHLYTIEGDMGEFLEDGFMSGQQASLVRGEVRRLLRALRPEAVGLAEAFAWPDFFLDSALGSSDGRAYERMMEWLKREPLNTVEMKDGVVRGYEEYIRPLIHGEVGVWRDPNAPDSVQARL